MLLIHAIQEVDKRKQAEFDYKNGFRRVFKALIQADKPLVGHNWCASTIATRTLAHLMRLRLQPVRHPVHVVALRRFELPSLSESLIVSRA